MAISNIPTFTDGEILTASKLNQLGTAVSTKFSGAVTGADMVWPLVAQGNINMSSQYTLSNLRTLWNVVNVAEYDTVADAIAALPTGGGCLFIPPGTVTTDGQTLDTSNTLVLGTGRGSILKITASASSGYLMRTSTGLSNIEFADLTIDGNTNTGSGQDGLQIRDCVGVRISGVYFNDFSGESLVLTHSGSQGNPCEEVLIYGCHFEAGSGDQLLMDDVDGVQIVGCRFENPTTKCINGTPSNSSSLMRSILVQGCKFSDAANSIYIVGGSGTASDLWRLVRIIGNEILTDSGTAITCGTASAIVKHGIVQGNVAVGITGDGVKALLSTGLIEGNYMPSMGGDGCDFSSSADAVVKNNIFSDNGAYGVDAQSTTNCRVLHNDCHNSTTEAIIRDSATGLVVENNYVDNGQIQPGRWYWQSPAADADSSGTSGTFSTTVTIPANTVKVGDVIQIIVACSHAGTGADATFSVDYGTNGTNGTATVLDASEEAVQMIWLHCTATSGAGALQGMIFGQTNEATIGLAEQPWDINSDEAAGLTIDLTADLTLSIDWTKATGSNTIALKNFGVMIIPG